VKGSKYTAEKIATKRHKIHKALTVVYSAAQANYCTLVEPITNSESIDKRSIAGKIVDFHCTPDEQRWRIARL